MVKKGISNLKNTVEILIGKVNLELLKNIERDSDFFSDPHIISFFNYREKGNFDDDFLSFLATGYLVNQNLNMDTTKFSDDIGISYIPNQGYYKGNDLINPIHTFKDTSIELVQYNDKIIDNILFNLINHKDYIVSKELTFTNSEIIEESMRLIKKHCIDFFEQLNQCCKKIVLFNASSSSTNSFASINHHGMIFLNVNKEFHSKVFFVDDISHQAGHVILDTIFLSGEQFFLLDKNYLISNLNKYKDDHRDVYILIHALYTYYCITSNLDNIIESGVLNSTQNLEAKSRIGFYIMKFSLDLGILNELDREFGYENLFSIPMLNIIKSIFQKYTYIYDKWYLTVENYNYTNQSYDFDFILFNELNS